MTTNFFLVEQWLKYTYLNKSQEKAISMNKYKAPHLKRSTSVPKKTRTYGRFKRFWFM